MNLKEIIKIRYNWLIKHLKTNIDIIVKLIFLLIISIKSIISIIS